jgi:hypothetical protein
LRADPLEAVVMLWQKPWLDDCERAEWKPLSPQTVCDREQKRQPREGHEPQLLRA